MKNFLLEAFEEIFNGIKVDGKLENLKGRNW